VKTSWTSILSQINTDIFDTANFVDSTTIDFTVTPGASVTAIVAAGSIDETHLSIASPSTGTNGEVLTSDGAGGFEWTTPSATAKKTWSWGASANAPIVTDRYLDRHDGAPTNQSPYVAFFACTLTNLTLASNAASTWTAEVYVNGVSAATLVSGGAQYAQSGTLSIAIAAGDRISFYVNGTAVNKPSVDALFEEA
jgi:hypothetical protein